MNIYTQAIETDRVQDVGFKHKAKKAHLSARKEPYTSFILSTLLGI